MIRVVNVRGMNKPEERAGVVYVGRPFAGWKGHRLYNPLRPNRGLSIEDCLDGYRRHLANGIRDLEGALRDLWEETQCGVKPLGCWCVSAVAGDGQPVVCHAQVLAEMLRERFEPKTDDTDEWEPEPEIGGEG